MATGIDSLPHEEPAREHGKVKSNNVDSACFLLVLFWSTHPVGGEHQLPPATDGATFVVVAMLED